jgi:hypothetical protein
VPLCEDCLFPDSEDELDFQVTELRGRKKCYILDMDQDSLSMTSWFTSPGKFLAYRHL